MTTILIVDDSPTVHSMLKAYLQPLGFKIVSEFNGKAGLEKAKAVKPNIILTDLNMPVMDGFEFITSLRKDTDTQHIPILMFTTYGNSDNVKKALALGVDDFLTKPFEREALVKKILRILDTAPDPQVKKSAFKFWWQK